MAFTTNMFVVCTESTRPFPQSNLRTQTPFTKILTSPSCRKLYPIRAPDSYDMSVCTATSDQMSDKHWMDAGRIALLWVVVLARSRLHRGVE
jgi:hypothetical protein